MTRSDDERREDSLQQALGSAERMNIQRADKITELERIIVEAKKCVRITQEKNDELQSRMKGLKIYNDAKNKKTKEQIAALGKEIDKLRTNNMEALEQIWDKLKLIKIRFC